MRKQYFLKKYAPGTGEIITLDEIEGMFGLSQKEALKKLKPHKFYKYFRELSYNQKNQKGAENTIQTIHTKTFEVWK